MRKAIIVKNLNDNQLHMLVDYLIANHYKWNISTLDKKSITRCEVLYMDDDKGLSYSTLITLKNSESKVVTFNELIQMKKSDLKPGMVVEYASGDKRLVVTINDELCLIGENSFAEMGSFNDDLTCNGNPDINIVKVYQPEEAASLNTLLKCGDCIWERPKETVLTMQEIADKFGIPVEQIRIKKNESNNQSRE